MWVWFRRPKNIYESHQFWQGLFFGLLAMLIFGIILVYLVYKYPATTVRRR